MVLRVCVIGAGPSGMSTLASFKKLANEGLPVEVTCYEQQKYIGGIWNLTWRTGVDEYGEPLHNSMYRDLFSNGPKECVEFPEYTFRDHFKKNIPSCPPRAVLLDYLMGSWKRDNVSIDDVLTSHCVKNVTYNGTTETFSVKVLNLKTSESKESEFDYLVIATSHFSVPFIPVFEGIEGFNGRALHAHNFRNGREFTGQKILLIGASYSAEDLTLQLIKFGAAHITISHRTKATGFGGWPENVNEVPLLSRIEDKTCHFINGESGEYDAIIFCTGYQCAYPFLPSELSLKCGNEMSPPNLYRGVQWVPNTSDGLNLAAGRLFYLGMQNLYYTYTHLMVQALWSVHVIKGLLQTPSVEEKRADIDKCTEQSAAIKNCVEGIDFQTAMVNKLVDDVKYPHDLDIGSILKKWDVHKHNNILTYRDQSFVSKFSNDVAPVHPVPFMKCFDDSLKGYIDACE